MGGIPAGARPERFAASFLSAGESFGFAPTDQNLFVVTNMIVSVQGAPLSVGTVDVNGSIFGIYPNPDTEGLGAIFNQDVWIPLEPGDLLTATNVTLDSMGWLAAGWSWPYAYPLGWTP